MQAEIIGMGWVTPTGLGTGRGASEFRLETGELMPLKRSLFFDRPLRRFGRLDTYSRLGIGAIALALRDAGLEEWEQKRACGLTLGTASGCLQTDIAYFRTVMPENGALASPNLFAFTLPNCLLGEAAVLFGLTGPAFVAEADTPGGLAGVTAGLHLLRWGLCETVLAGWCNTEETSGHTAVLKGAVFFVIRPGAADSPLAGTETEVTWNGERISQLSELAEFARARLIEGRP